MLSKIPSVVDGRRGKFLIFPRERRKPFTVRKVAGPEKKLGKRKKRPGLKTGTLFPGTSED